MFEIATANTKKLRDLGVDAFWREDAYVGSPTQIAIWLRDSFTAIWGQFPKAEKNCLETLRSGVSLHSIRNYVFKRYPYFFEASEWQDNDDEDDGGEHIKDTSSSALQIFRVLQTLGDFSYIGRGQYIPRESRIIQLAPGWARFAGTLNTRFSNLPDEFVDNEIAGTIGRLVKSPASPNTLSVRNELSFMLASQTRLRTLAEIVAPILDQIEQKSAVDLSETSFFSPTGSKQRRPTWQKTPLHDGLCLCKVNANDYFVAKISMGKQSTSFFHEVSNDERKLLEHHFRQESGFGTLAAIRKTEECVELRLTHSLPRMFEIEFQAASSSFARDPEYGWLQTFRFQEAAFPYISLLLKTLGIKYSL